MLKRLTELDGVSGYEKNVREAIIEQIKDYADSYKTDAMGNLIVLKKAKNGGDNVLNVILSAHMDEVGFIVTEITGDGMLKFDTVGGIDPSVLASKRVRKGALKGVIGLKPVHLISGGEKEKALSYDELFIDIGALSKEDAEKYVMPGDYFAFDSSYKPMGKNFVKAKALDDRLGCAVIIELLKEEYNCNLICLFSVQEETGLRGAKTASFGIDADYAVVIEGTTAGDVTGAAPHMAVTRAGGGAALSIMDSSSIADKELLQMLEDTAAENNIKIQYKSAATGGNDAGAIHTANGGIRTCSVSVPARYIHSASSVICLDDFESVKALAKAFLKSLKPFEEVL